MLECVYLIVNNIVEGAPQWLLFFRSEFFAIVMNIEAHVHRLSSGLWLCESLMGDKRCPINMRQMRSILLYDKNLFIKFSDHQQLITHK